jgi:hypothetical protein
MKVHGALEWGARALVAGSIAASLLVLADRGLRFFEIPPIAYAAWCGACALVGLIHGWLRGPGAHDVAAALDARMALKDRLATAAAIDAHAVAASEFAPLVRADAERIAARLSPRSAAPYEYSHSWTAAALSVAALGAAVLYLPEYARASAIEGVRSPEEAAAVKVAQAEASAALDESIADLREAPPRGASEEDIARLDELAAQLRREDLPPRDFAAARDQAAEELDKLATRVRSQAERDQKVMDELNRQFRSLGERERPAEQTPGAADALAEALSRGEYGEASQAVEDLGRQIEKMTAEERQALARELRQMRDEITRSPADAENDRAAAESMREMLREQGLSDEAIDELIPPAADEATAEERGNGGEQSTEQEQEPPASESPVDDPPTPEDIANRLEEEGIEREQAEQLAEEIARERESEMARREAEQTADNLSQSLEELAEEVEKEDSPDAGTDPQLENEKPPREGSGAQEGDAEESRDREAEREQATQEGEQAERSAQQQRESTEGSEQRQERQQQRETGEGQQQEVREGTRDQADEQQQREELSEREEQGAERESEEQCPNCAPGQPCPEHAESQAGEREGDPGEARQNEGDQSGEKGNQQGEESARERLNEALRELQNRQTGAGESRRQSEEMRERARDLAEKLTPEERQRLEQWSREFAREDDRNGEQDTPDRSSSGRGLPPGDGRGETGREGEPADDEFFTDAREIDLRDGGGDERTVAEWLASERPEGDPGSTGDGEGASRAGQAQRAAERAVNDGAVPRRYHGLIQRYFGRLRETVDKAAEKNGASSE